MACAPSTRRGRGGNHPGCVELRMGLLGLFGSDVLQLSFKTWGKRWENIPNSYKRTPTFQKERQTLRLRWAIGTRSYRLRGFAISFLKVSHTCPLGGSLNHQRHISAPKSLALGEIVDSSSQGTSNSLRVTQIRPASYHLVRTCLNQSTSTKSMIATWVGYPAPLSKPPGLRSPTLLVKHVESTILGTNSCWVW